MSEILKPLMTDETGQAIVEALTQQEMTQTRISEINAAADTSKQEIGSLTDSSKQEISSLTDSSKQEISSLTDSSKQEISSLTDSSKQSIETKTDEQVARIPEVTKLSEDVSSLRNELSGQVANSDIRVALLADTIPNTTQQYVFDTDGAISRINHTRDGQAVRVDAYVFTEEMVKETRTLSTGESLTIATNLTTLETNVAYAAPV